MQMGTGKNLFTSLKYYESRYLHNKNDNFEGSQKFNLSELVEDFFI